MKILASIRDFDKFTPLARPKAKEDMTTLDAFHNYSVYCDKYNGIGCLFREGTTLRRYFEHQHSIGKAPLQYLTSSLEKHGVIKKIFDFTLGSMVTSAVEIVFHVARAVYHMAMLLFTYIKRGPSEDISKTLLDHFIRGLSDATKLISHHFKAIPIIGVIASIYIFDFARFKANQFFEPKEVDLMSGGMFIEEESCKDAVELDMDGVNMTPAKEVGRDDFERADLLNALAEQEALRRQHDITTIGSFENEELTPSQGCFLTSEVSRLAEALSSHIDLQSDRGEITESSPMETLEVVIRQIFQSLHEGATRIDFSPWNGAFKSTSEANKARLAVIAYLLKSHPEKMAKIVEIGGTTNELLLLGSIYYANLPIFEWLHSGPRALITIESREFNLLQALMQREKAGKSDPQVVSSINGMSRFYMSNCLCLEQG